MGSLSPHRRSGASSSCSSYYSTSAAKAQLLTQLKDFADDGEKDDDDELTYKVPRRPGWLRWQPETAAFSCFSPTKVSSVAQKQLMESLRKKLGVLREAQRGLQDDVRANAQLGEEVGSEPGCRATFGVKPLTVRVPRWRARWWRCANPTRWTSSACSSATWTRW